MRIHQDALSVRIALALALAWVIAQQKVCAAVAADPSDDFFTHGPITHLRITLDRTAMDSLQQESRRYVRATVTEGSTVHSNVGLHLKGNFTFQFLDQKPCLTLNFDKFARGQKFHGLDKFHLNNSLQDPTLLAEYLGGALFRAANIPAPRVTHAHVELNGRDLGLYVLVEGFDKTFLRRHFSDASGDLYDGGERTDVADPLRKTSGAEPENRGDLQVLAAAARGPASNRLARLQAVLDLERFHSFLALETLTCHWDGYAMGRNNYRLYRDPARGRFLFLPHGMDQLFGRPRAALFPDCAGLVAGGVLATPAGRARHWDRCADLFAKLFADGSVTNQLDAAQRRVHEALTEMNPKAASTYDQTVSAWRQQIDERVRFLNSQLHAPSLEVSRMDSAGEARLTNWVAHLDGGEAHLNELADALQVRNIGQHIPLVASWRTRVLLPPGRYRFQGQVSATGLRPMPGAPGGGIALRVFGYPLRVKPALPSEVTGTPLGVEFVVVGPPETVQLICEVRAFTGTVGFDKASLNIRRIEGNQ